MGLNIIYLEIEMGPNIIFARTSDLCKSIFLSPAAPISSLISFIIHHFIQAEWTFQFYGNFIARERQQNAQIWMLGKPFATSFFDRSVFIGWLILSLRGRWALNQCNGGHQIWAQIRCEATTLSYYWAVWPPPPCLPALPQPPAQSSFSHIQIWI